MKPLVLLLPLIAVLSCNDGSENKATQEERPAVDSQQPAGNAMDSVNRLLAAVPGNWQVVTDPESGLTPDAISYFIEGKRKLNPEYPYIVRGDYNCDGARDIAALAVDSSRAIRLAFIFSDGKISWWEEDMQGAALTNFPKQDFGAMKDEKELKVSLQCDAVEAEWFEKAVQVIYWDGKKFVNVWTAD